MQDRNEGRNDVQARSQTTPRRRVAETRVSHEACGDRVREGPPGQSQQVCFAAVTCLRIHRGTRATRVSPREMGVISPARASDLSAQASASADPHPEPYRHRHFVAIRAHSRPEPDGPETALPGPWGVPAPTLAETNPEGRANKRSGSRGPERRIRRGGAGRWL